MTNNACYSKGISSPSHLCLYVCLVTDTAYVPVILFITVGAKAACVVDSTGWELLLTSLSGKLGITSQKALKQKMRGSKQLNDVLNHVCACV